MTIPNATFSTEKWLPWRLLHLPYLWSDFLTTDTLDDGFLIFSVLLSFLSFVGISPEKLPESEKVRHHLTSSQESQRKFYPDGTVNWWGLGQQTLNLSPHSTNSPVHGVQNSLSNEETSGCHRLSGRIQPIQEPIVPLVTPSSPQGPQREPAASVLPI